MEVVCRYRNMCTTLICACQRWRKQNSVQTSFWPKLSNASLRFYTNGIESKKNEDLHFIFRGLWPGIWNFECDFWIRSVTVALPDCVDTWFFHIA